MRPMKILPLMLIPPLAFLLLLTSCDLGPRGEAHLGQAAPDFILEDLEGRNWRLSDQRGQVVLVYFWATWCPPCREALPALEGLHQEMVLAGKPFQMLTILTNDDPVQAGRFVKQLGITFPILTDSESKVGRLYGLTGVPEAWIVDPNGILRERFIGSRRWDSAEAREILESYMLPPN